MIRTKFRYTRDDYWTAKAVLYDQKQRKLINSKVNHVWLKEDTTMRNWMDLNGDGEIDVAEMMFAEEMLCTSRGEHEALFGNAGDFEEDDIEADLEMDAIAVGLDVNELEFMDADERAEALEEAGLDPDDYDFD